MGADVITQIVSLLQTQPVPLTPPLENVIKGAGSKFPERKLSGRFCLQNASSNWQLQHEAVTTGAWASQGCPWIHCPEHRPECRVSTRSQAAQRGSQGRGFLYPLPSPTQDPREPTQQVAVETKGSPFPPKASGSLLKESKSLQPGGLWDFLDKEGAGV